MRARILENHFGRWGQVQGFNLPHQLLQIGLIRSWTVDPHPRRQERFTL